MQCQDLLFPTAFAPVLFRLQRIYFRFGWVMRSLISSCALGFRAASSFWKCTELCFPTTNTLRSLGELVCCSRKWNCSKTRAFSSEFFCMWHLDCHFLNLIPCMVNEYVIFRTLERTWETRAVLVTFPVTLNKCFLSWVCSFPDVLKPNNCHWHLLSALSLWICPSLCHGSSTSYPVAV